MSSMFAPRRRAAIIGAASIRREIVTEAVCYASESSLEVVSPKYALIAGSIDVSVFVT